MTINLVSAAARFLTPDVVRKIAAASGLEDSTLGQQAVNAAVPTILSGLASLAGKPGGAKKIGNAIADQSFDPAGIVSQIASSTNLAADGTRILSSLLGGNVSGTLAAILGRFVGAGEGSMRMVLGLLAPVIMSVLGREQRAANLDDNGLARMLGEQKDAITAAMPSGLKSILEDAMPFASIPTVAPAAERRSYDAPAADRYVPRTAGIQHAVEEPQASRGVHWAYWALPLLALGALFWYMLPAGPDVEPQPRTTSLPPRTEATKVAYLQTVPTNWVSIGSAPNEYVNADIYNRAGEKVGTVKDILVGPDGKMNAAVINVGRFLGIGDRDVAVPFSTLKVENREAGRRIVIDAVKEGLLAAPAFDQRVPKQ
jgi:sporulation protein YlmC with PRC-barrel domain